MTTMPEPEHACGICDAPIRFDGYDDTIPTWKCDTCDWWHTSKDCCHGYELEETTE